jgi:hypothetical protein
VDSRWYSEKLGLKVVMRVPKTDKAAVTVLEGGGLIVELIQHDDALPLNNVIIKDNAGNLIQVFGKWAGGV